VSELNEYDYLRAIAHWRYVDSREEALLSIEILHQAALKNQDYDRAILLAAAHKEIQKKLFTQYVRAEDIINWLQLDSDLRQENLTYPDIYEQCLNKNQLKRE
jgi:hypothetical protein